VAESGVAMTEGAVLGWNLAFSAAACALCLAFLSPRFAASFALGALVEAANFRSLWRSSARILLPNGMSSGPTLAAFGLRFVLLGLLVAFALRGGAHPVGLLAGLSMIVPAILLAAWRARPPVVPSATALAPDDPSWDRWNPWLARERDDEEEDP
jgi:hypothetical protein